MVKVLRKLEKYASLNHQPVREETRQRNQTAGYLGNPLKPTV